MLRLTDVNDPATLPDTWQLINNIAVLTGYERHESESKSSKRESPASGAWLYSPTNSYRLVSRFFKDWKRTFAALLWMGRIEQQQLFLGKILCLRNFHWRTLLAGKQRRDWCRQRIYNTISLSPWVGYKVIK